MCDKIVDPLLDLSGKVAVISGGSSGITARQGALSMILDIDVANAVLFFYRPHVTMGHGHQFNGRRRRTCLKPDTGKG